VYILSDTPTHIPPACGNVYERDRNDRMILVRGVNAPLPPEAKKIVKIRLRKMVHSEVCVNKYVVSIAPFSTSA